MTVKRNPVNGGPRQTRGSSPWLWLAMAGLLAVGVRQMFQPAKKIVAPGQGQAAQTITPFASVCISASVSHRQIVRVESDNPLVDFLARLIQDLQAEEDQVKREELITSFLDSLKTEDISAMLGVLKNTQPSELAADLSQRLIRRWTNDDPPAAAAWVMNLPSGSQRTRAMENLAIVWANCQLTNAISWAQSLPDVSERNVALIVVGNEIVRTEPLSALQLAVNLPSDAARDELICRATTEWAAKDATNAVAWAEQIPNETLRAGVLAGEAVTWSDQDPEAAATLAIEELPAGRLQNDTVISIIQRWAQQQPEAAAAWVAQFPEGPVRAAAIENLIVQWSQKDAAAAQLWLSEHS